ncbi:TetR/AcrR family transcriptional regulator [Actinotalea sp. C106]|uniref:TetR/AcrR family transcriptional regulator n=1 Tax=Actinotalea sp. C106 TaxID=2908644 RepID=UPI0020286044|nr:TetR/AcrR family transcriptional regulator [Actinotalea sp. C106]
MKDDPAAQEPEERGPAPGLRERKKQARREALIDAAQRLVQEHGLDGVTVDAICAEAGVSTRTFFNYFDSKDGAVLGHGPWVLDAEVARAFAAGGPTGRLSSDLGHLVTGLVGRQGIGRRRVALAMQIARSEPRLLGRQVMQMEQHHQQVAAVVGERLGTDPGSPRAEMLSLVVLTLTRAAYVRWDADGGHGEVRDAVPQVLAELRDLIRDD